MAQEQDKKRNRISLPRLLVLLLAVGVFAYSGIQLFRHWDEDRQSRSEQQGLIDQAVVTVETQQPSSSEAEQETQTEETNETQPQQLLAPPPPIYVDFEVLRQENEDIVAWIYCPDTVMNYPVVQGEDNMYYVDHMSDGTQNPHGAIFVDFRNLSDFSDYNTIIYGHNMANKTMFAALHSFREQEFYEEHPYLWIITADKAYRLDLIAGLVTASDSEAYQLYNSQEELRAHVQTCLDQSVFDAGEVDVSKIEHVMTLSTCSYEFSTARFILIGNPVEAEYPVKPEVMEEGET